MQIEQIRLLYKREVTTIRHPDDGGMMDLRLQDFSGFFIKRVIQFPDEDENRTFQLL
jgi:hypothetical protein